MKSSYIASLIALLVVVAVGVGCGSGNHLVSVKVSPNPVNMVAPQTLQLQAIGVYSDGSTQVLGSATWTLTAQFVTISHSGIATCAQGGGPVNGNSMVTASYAGLSGSAPMNCQGPGL